MSLLPEGASLEELVQDCFLAYRGCGLTLSALDAELLSQWVGSGAPFEVIASGIRRAAEKAAWRGRPGEPALRSLRACRRDVESEIRRHQWRSTGATAERRSMRRPRSPAERRAKLLSALDRLARVRPELIGEIESFGSSLGRGPAQLKAREDFDLWEARLLRALPFAERLELLREAGAETNGLSQWASSRARKLCRRFHRAAALRKRLGLPAFW
jgi:hypothetical protein